MADENQPILRRGDVDRDGSDAIKKLQEKLTEAGFDVGEDGRYGKNTQKAVRKLERENDLPVDGVTGPKVWNALDNTIKKEAEADKPHPFKEVVHAVSQEAKEFIQNTTTDTASVSEYRKKLIQNAEHAALPKIKDKEGELVNNPENNNKGGKYTGGEDVFWCAGFDDKMRENTMAECGVHQDLVPLKQNLAARFGGIESTAKDLGVFHKIGDGYQMQPGDSVIFKRPDPHNSDAGHVGIVESVDIKNGTFTYIAGNVPHHNGPIVSTETRSVDDHNLVGVVDEGALYEKARDRQLAQNKADLPQFHTDFALLAPALTPTIAKEKTSPAQSK